MYTKFKTKISKFCHVEHDPKFDCKSYYENATYNDCIEKEVRIRFHELIGCHPPLISDKRDKMCNKTFNSTQSDPFVKKVLDLNHRIFNYFQSTTCKKPCTYYTFDTRQLYSFTMNRTDNRIKVVLDNTVDLTQTHFLIGVPSLLSGLGGAISGGRTLLWFIISILGLCKILRNYYSYQT